jgi:hypothetical protein
LEVCPRILSSGKRTPSFDRQAFRDITETDRTKKFAIKRTDLPKRIIVPYRMYNLTNDPVFLGRRDRVK